MRVTDEDLDAIPGWFDAIDRELFRWFLGPGRAISGPGNLAELGVYMGQSAVLLGGFLENGEELTVVDLFESEAGDTANVRENAESYPGLSREAFEANYTRVHPDLPHVLQDFSERIVDHVAPGSCRFVHVDASHLFEHVRHDVVAAEQLLGTAGVVTFDDYRAGHTPGVAAAVWEAVANQGLRPIVLSPNKLYATWGDPTPYLSGIARETPWWTSETQSVAGGELLVLSPVHHESYRWIKYLPPAAVPLAKRARAGLATLTKR
ncbi:class I SAM-dependent methyltransferase [Nocardioides sp. zg-1308]|uniref:Class I SAM-dependent methyltransferase n=1 Tax=Nocardioides renjunii TaxID=3095075 RepID=A0ABU5K749_9ACTN|nr:class I SAM-dependent methyltransferase [Nocardioides sp. S-58]MDZ5660792.1 class I SAM-dependent methyltransferase [Nocardioides sp. S-58]NPD03915.1 class I SAM-dependent methyltransferase [Nocardioides sp. zg-1308]